MTGRNLLIVEDDDEIASFLCRGLSGEGYVVDIAATGEAARGRVADGGVRLVILDRMLPDAEGVELCQAFRREDPDLLVLMLTAKDGLGDKLEGLRAGADDYMTKPFAFEELLARVEALFRRAGPEGENRSEIVFGNLRLDPARKVAWRGGRELNLTATEFALLRYLTENAGSVVSRIQILQAVWGYDFDPNTNIVEVYIAYLRRKVDRDADEKLVRNVRGFGYTLGG